MRMCHFRAQNGPFVLNKIFLVQTIIITFIYLLALFIVQNFKKLQPIQNYEDVPFSGPKWPICHEQNFFGTNHYYYFHLPIGPFHCAKFKKNSYSRSRVMRMCNFWCQNRDFQIVVRGGEGVLLRAEFFYWVKSTWEGVILTIQTFFKAKNSFLWILNFK